MGETKVRTTKEDMERYKEEAKKLNLSLNQFFIEAAEEKIENNTKKDQST